MATPEPGLPRRIGAPATRALTAAGYTELSQLASVPAADLAQLHGVRPKTLFFFSSRRRHTRLQGDWSSDVSLPIFYYPISVPLTSGYRTSHHPNLLLHVEPR